MTVPWRDRRGRFLPLKAAVLVAVFVPGAVSAYWWATSALGGRPVTELIHNSGLWTIRFLLLALAVTPLRATLNWGGLLLVRRTLGVTAFAYAVAHFCLYIVDQNGRLLVVGSEILHRFYLTIGFSALLGLTALAVTSTDGAMRRMRRWWKRLHRLTYLVGLLALLHYFIQSKANVSEPVFVSGLFVWLMVWRILPASWQQQVALYPLLAVLAAMSAASIEYVWYSLATHVNASRVLAANETLSFGLRPAHLVLLTTLGLSIVIGVRRITPSLRLRQRISAMRVG